MDLIQSEFATKLHTYVLLSVTYRVSDTLHYIIERSRTFCPKLLTHLLCRYPWIISILISDLILLSKVLHETAFFRNPTNLGLIFKRQLRGRWQLRKCCGFELQRLVSSNLHHPLISNIISDMFLYKNLKKQSQDNLVF